jgi:phenylalanyl-tRNA synthetase beta chain
MIFLTFVPFIFKGKSSMKVSYNWLKTYVDIDLTPSRLAELLTSIGLEVGGLEEVESIKGGMKGLVTGEVVTCIPHPNSDHLSITTVNTGGPDLLPIVCGAPNVAAGQKVVVALVGTTLYDGDKEFSIKKAKIRGEVSEGMICSEVEIGIGADGSGIMVLPDGTPTGIPASEYFNVESDWVIEVDITPNRIDGASHIGIARDVAAALRLSGDKGYRKPSVDAFKVENHDLNIPVEVLNPEACPRYSGVTISGVEVKESPAWLRNRLKSIGLTPINNVVDVTNFVLFETGQPLHAFDASEIKGGKVVVKTMQPNSRFVTLDSTDRKLDGNDLMICNAEEGMCIGGVFGGLKSGVKLSTKNIFLESACFDPVFIRKTARRHGLFTDASFRFERGTDINGTVYALKRAALLIREVAGGKVSSEITDFYPDPVKGFPVDISYHNVNRLIGKEIPRIELKAILTSLEITIERESEWGLSLIVPTYRVDVHREVDVIEEILRIYGYNNVEIPQHVNASLSYAEKPDPNRIKNVISDQLAARGFYEMWSNSLTRAGYYDDMEHFRPDNTVKLFNPLSNDLNGMRQTLLYGGLECIQLNTNRRNSDLRLFEFGNCYFFKGTHYKEDPAANYFEEEHLALFLTGNQETANWTSASLPASFYQLKSHVENILMRLGLEPDNLKVSDTENEIFSEGLVYETEEKNKLVEFGIVAGKWIKKFDIENPVYYADFDWGQVLWEVKKQSVKFSELPKYPEVRRDLALVLDKDIKFSTLKNIAFASERQLLRSVNLFDVYEGKGVPEGKKSYAISYILRDDLKTLTDKQIDKAMERILTAYEKQTGARLR